MNSRPVTITQVYAQDTAPNDTRDGVMWVDTSVSPPDTYVRDATTASWEPVAPGNVTISSTAPTGVNDGHVWVDTSVTPPLAKTYEADDGSWYRVGKTNQEVRDASRVHSEGMYPGFLG